MKKIKILTAGKVIAVELNHPKNEEYFRDYLTEKPAQLEFAVTAEDIAFERAKSIREAELEGLPAHDYSDAYLETIAIQRKIAEEFFCRDILLFHGSVIAVDGTAYLFTARSGTGKSTHTRLWREMLGDRAVMVNDDKPFLEITEAGVIAHGSPWNGKHGLGTNISVPLKAICVLERGAENKIVPMEPRDAIFMLLQQSNRPRNRALLPKYMELLDKLSQKVEFYRLECTISPKSAELAYHTMRK